MFTKGPLGQKPGVSPLQLRKRRANVDDVTSFADVGESIAADVPARMKVVTRRNDPKSTPKHLHKACTFTFIVLVLMFGCCPQMLAMSSSLVSRHAKHRHATRLTGW
jgi:hypothetical protein